MEPALVLFVGACSAAGVAAIVAGGARWGVLSAIPVVLWAVVMWMREPTLDMASREQVAWQTGVLAAAMALAGLATGLYIRKGGQVVRGLVLCLAGIGTTTLLSYALSALMPQAWPVLWAAMVGCVSCAFLLAGFAKGFRPMAGVAWVAALVLGLAQAWALAMSGGEGYESLHMVVAYDGVGDHEVVLDAWATGPLEGTVRDMLAGLESAGNATVQHEDGTLRIRSTGPYVLELRRSVATIPPNVQTSDIGGSVWRVDQAAGRANLTFQLEWLGCGWMDIGKARLELGPGERAAFPPDTNESRSCAIG